MSNTNTQIPAFAPQMGVFQGFGATIQVHPDHIGFISGKRFSTLSEIGRATHTRIHVVNGGDPSRRTIMIGGRSVADVTACYERLMHVAREAEARTPRVAGWSPAMTALNIVTLQGFEHRVEVHKEDVGMVLGAKGSTLRKLGKDTWTWIKFFKATDKSPPIFSIRGFLQEDVGKAVMRMLSIAQESFNRRTGGARHFKQPRAQEPMTMGDKATFHMAPVPQSRKVSFKEGAPQSPTYAPHSPPFPSTVREPRSVPVMPRSLSPTYSPHTPQTPRTPPSA